MATSKRHFEWFYCDVELTLCLAGETRVVRSYFEFYCAYSLRAIQSCVNINCFLPKRFCDAKLTFRRVEPVLTQDFSNSYFHMRSYQDITRMAIRNIIYQ